jgi:hypothetical protein
MTRCFESVLAAVMMSDIAKFNQFMFISIMFVGFNSFNLGNDGVSVSVKPWQGDLEPFAELEEVWLKVKGIPPKWCEWKLFDQLASSYGLLMDVDWQGIFSTFYETVRMKIKCRDVTKIPRERLFCMDKKLYKVTITVEQPKIEDVGKKDDGADDGSGKGHDGADNDNFDDVDDLDDEKPQGRSMDVHQSNKQGGSTHKGQSLNGKTHQLQAKVGEGSECMEQGLVEAMAEIQVFGETDMGEKSAERECNLERGT